MQFCKKCHRGIFILRVTPDEENIINYPVTLKEDEYRSTTINGKLYKMIWDCVKIPIDEIKKLGICAKCYIELKYPGKYIWGVRKSRYNE